MMRTRAPRRFRPRWDLLDERTMLSGYTPVQITAAYGLNAITFTSSNGTKFITGDGTGQTIALVEVYHNPNIQAELDVFDTMYGLPALKVNVVNQAGNQTDTGWAGEEALDVEWAHAIALGRTSWLWKPRRVRTMPTASTPLKPRSRPRRRPKACQSSR